MAILFVLATMASVGCSKEPAAPPVTEEPAASAAPPTPATAVPTTSPKPAPTSETPASKLARLAQGAMSAGEIEEIVGKNEWAFYPPATTDCPDPENTHVNLTVPETNDEFEAKKLQSQRGAITSAVVGKLVRFQGDGIVSADRGSVGDFEVTLSKYDFTRKAWTLTIAFDSMKTPYWPIGATDPTISATTLDNETDREIAKLGGKSLTVKGTESHTIYENRSKLTVTVPMAPDVAELHKDALNVRILLVEKFAGLGFHKACQQDCSTILGVPGCSTINNGAGTFYRASPVGYEITVEGEIAAQKQPN